MLQEHKHRAGLKHLAAGRLTLAENALRAVVEANPRSAAARYDLGVTLYRRHRFRLAARELEAAVAIDPGRAAAHAALAASLLRVGEESEAEPHARRALELDPRLTFALVTLGDVMRGLNRLADARAAYDAALATDPHHALARFGRGFVNLLDGDLATGWLDYEFRALRRAPIDAALRPQWRGESLTGRRLLVYGEQGLGDCLQFLRYAELLAERGAQVLAAVPGPLARLTAGIDGVHEVVPKAESLPPFDYCCPLPSLPLFARTRLDTVPRPDGYVGAPTEHLARWKARLGETAKLTVALAWAGNPDHSNDHHRSARLADLAPLLAVPDVRWLSLQTGAAALDIRSRRGDADIIDLGAELADFCDTAAIVAVADLVISVDTALCHLGGAMGRPTWTLLAHAPDWRWLLGRSDSPWYASMKLYRQARPKDWTGVVGEMARDLRVLAGASAV